jgi:hypothetical protein
VKGRKWGRRKRGKGVEKKYIWRIWAL